MAHGNVQTPRRLTAFRCWAEASTRSRPEELDRCALINQIIAGGHHVTLPSRGEAEEECVMGVPDEV
jgi:hypothetical protein